MESDSGLTSYELRVKRNIEENQRVLQSLGLLKPINEHKKDSKKAVRRSNVDVKRKSSFKPNEESPASFIPARRTRRSSSILKFHGLDESDNASVDAYDEENTPPQKKKREAPKPIFGPIEDVRVGDWWSTRIECSAAGVHRPTVAGIHGKLEEGCYSLALSGGYEDDIDYGECFTYTGCGGRDLKGTKTNPKNLRTAPQTKDQVLEGSNAALALNIENRRPVRVIRGYKLPSPYAPEEGYRYDGLYSVERSWTATGLSGYKVYKFALKRLQDQDPPPWLSNSSDTAHNGYTDTESRYNGVQEERLGEEYNNTQTDASDFPAKASGHLKSSNNISSNSLENISDDREVSDKNSQIVLKRKRTSSNSTCSPKGDLEEESEIPIENSNSTQNVSEYKDVTEKHSDTILKRSRRSNTSKIDHEGTGEELKFHRDLLNSTQNCSDDKDLAEKHHQIAPKRKGTLSDSNIYLKKTRQESESPTNPLSSSKHVLEDKDLIENISQLTLKRNTSINAKTKRERSGLESEELNEGKLGDFEKKPNDTEKKTLFYKSTEKDNSNSNETEYLNSSQSNMFSANNQQTNIGNNALLSINGCLQGQLTPVIKNWKNKNVNTSQTDNIEQKSTCKSTKSIEKKVRFSPEICIKDAEGKRSSMPISSSDSENKSSARKLNYSTKLCDPAEINENVYPQENINDSSLCNSRSDSKKQTSILKYFETLKKPDVKRPISRGILLRSNRRSFNCSKVNVPEHSSTKYCTVPLFPVTISPTSQHEIESEKVEAENNSTQSKCVKSLFNEEKSSDKIKTELFHICDSTKNTVKKENILPRPGLSPIKPCSVLLVRLHNEQHILPSKATVVSVDKLEDLFLGWDWDIEEFEFLGFDLDEEHHLLCYGFEENPELLINLEIIRSVVERVSEIENLDVSKV